MLELIIGGSGSGKSEFAEARCMELKSKGRIYLATMEPMDSESFSRIGRHRQLREGKGFRTLECFHHLEELSIPADSTVLLECMSNLTANEMFSPKGRPTDTAEVILRGMKRLWRQARHLVVVTNQVFSDGITYDAETTRYLRTLGEINARIAARADAVWEVVHGIPIYIGASVEGSDQ